MVLQEALRQGISTLFFVARDGYLLKKMADVMIKEQKMKLQTRYLYGSRYAWRVPVVSLNKDDFRNWLLYNTKLATFDEVIELLHMKTDELAEYFPELFRQKGRNLSKKEEEIIKEIFLSDEELQQKIREKNEPYLDSAKGYLKQEILSSEGKIAFVEMNGTGFTQCCLQKAAADFYKEPVVTFFYSMACIGENMPDNVFYKYTGKRLVHIVEMLVRAPHGQTLGYSQGEEGKWIPILDDNNQEYGNEEYTAYMNGVLDFTRYMCKSWQCQGEELADISLAYVDHICKDPEPEVQDFIGDLSFSQSGTESGMRSYAPKMTDEQLKQLYLYQIPEEEWYPGCNLGFSLLRLSPRQKEMAEYYKSLNMPYIDRKPEYAWEVKGNIVLYGAGKKGRKVLRRLMKNPDASVVLWADKNYASCAAAEMEISPPSRIMKTDFDCVLIGVASDKLVREIRQELVEMGVPKGKILW